MPTLAGDARLLACLASLEAQTLPGVQVVVVDNSACGAIHRLGAARYRFRLIENRENVGFGAAINQGFRLAPADYLATLNDDAVADPHWLEVAIRAMEADTRLGMVAPRIELGETGRIDSAGMLVGRDGSTKQRGHGEPSGTYLQRGESLMPSGCAAVYRGAMLEEIGLFAEDFFLYCEDSDLGLRARWGGWLCGYEPEAVVRHSYSQSAGAASERKAWLVERNRLRLAVRCLPWSWVVASPLWTAWRYFWHAALMLGGQGKAAQFREDGGSAWQLVLVVVRAHLDLLANLPALLKQRRQIASTRKIPVNEYLALLRRFLISAREVAAQ